MVLRVNDLEFELIVARCVIPEDAVLGCCPIRVNDLKCESDCGSFFCADSSCS